LQALSRVVRLMARSRAGTAGLDDMQTSNRQSGDAFGQKKLNE